jgi:hypothetical protein
MIQEAPSTLKTNISARATISATLKIQYGDPYLLTHIKIQITAILKNTVWGFIFIDSHPDPK